MDNEFLLYDRLTCKTAGRYLNPEPKRKKYGCLPIFYYQLTDDFHLKISDKCCDKLKKEPLKEALKQLGKKYWINGILPSEGGQRSQAKCLAFADGKLKAFQPLVAVTKMWEEWFIDNYNVPICDIYKPPYNFKRTGCKGCPFNYNLQRDLDVMKEFFPAEYKQCEIIWKPVYDEYRRIGYRLKKEDQNE